LGSSFHFLEKELFSMAFIGDPCPKNITGKVNIVCNIRNSEINL
jgi:hypothetical protein